MKERYIELMRKTLTAYSDDHIRDYFRRVKEADLSEHGFPRLTANLGILIANGVRTDLSALFCDMMDFCCDRIPRVKAANDFSVREIICCILEIERTGAFDESIVTRWRDALRTIVPENCYDVYATSESDPVRNWALFTALSEFFRQYAGLCDSAEFIDIQIASQLRWLDENDMYMDNSHAETYQPIVYDLVPRGLFALLLHFGYKGRYFDRIDDALRRAGLLTLRMQSVTGELPFGGRSQQFVHNEAMMLLSLEYEANRYYREGNIALASRFKAAAELALRHVSYWLEKTPIRHNKNRFPTETFYGCEKYAYFDKYMITAASFLYAASLMENDAIPTAKEPLEGNDAFALSRYFHKCFLRSGDYFLEFDTDADPHYDASGLGRVHKKGAPSALCISAPCPATPKYKIPEKGAPTMSLSPTAWTESGWQYGSDTRSLWETEVLTADADEACAAFRVTLPSGIPLTSRYTVSGGGVKISIAGNGRVGCQLPAFAFDGETTPKITATPNALTITYEGWVCRCETSGVITEAEGLSYNRNGHYRSFIAAGDGGVEVSVEIYPA